VLQEFIAGVLNIDIGNYYHIVNSLHIYENHFAKAENIINNYKIVQMMLFDIGIKPYRFCYKDDNTNEKFQSNIYYSLNSLNKAYEYFIDILQNKNNLNTDILKTHITDWFVMFDDISSNQMISNHFSICLIYIFMVAYENVVYNERNNIKERSDLYELIISVFKERFVFYKEFFTTDLWLSILTFLKKKCYPGKEPVIYLKEAINEIYEVKNDKRNIDKVQG
jgi:hypothetical protein